MFGSQALDVAVGLALMLFVLSTAASAVLELVNRGLSRRAVNLEKALKGLLGGDGAPARRDQAAGEAKDRPTTDQGSWAAFAQTSVYQGALEARRTPRVPYLSARGFADAVVELAGPADAKGEIRAISGPAGVRLATLRREYGGDLVKIKAGLEQWYDEAMAGLTARFRKWSAVLLFGLGLALAVGTNASVVNATQSLWVDTASRDAAVAAASSALDKAPASKTTTARNQLREVAKVTRQLQAASLPVGWTEANRPGDGGRFWWWSSHVVGWLLTAALVSMGGPFWFDLLGRLVAARSPRPPTAAADSTSATRQLTT